MTVPRQLETVNAAYTDIRKSTGELLYPRLPAGGELGWLLPARETEPSGMDIDMFRYIANQNPAWDWRNFGLEKDIERAPPPRKRNSRRQSRPSQIQSARR